MPSKTKTNDREQLLIERLGEFKPESRREAAIRYGRKLLKYEAGERTSRPATTGLTKKDVDKIKTIMLGDES